MIHQTIFTDIFYFTGLILQEGILTVDEVVFLMIEHILKVLSDEALPYAEKIGTPF